MKRLWRYTMGTQDWTKAFCGFEYFLLLLMMQRIKTSDLNIAWQFLLILWQGRSAIKLFRQHASNRQSISLIYQLSFIWIMTESIEIDTNSEHKTMVVQLQIMNWENIWGNRIYRAQNVITVTIMTVSWRWHLGESCTWRCMVPHHIAWHKIKHELKLLCISLCDCAYVRPRCVRCRICVWKWQNTISVGERWGIFLCRWDHFPNPNAAIDVLVIAAKYRHSSCACFLVCTLCIWALSMECWYRLSGCAIDYIPVTCI